MQDFHAHLLLPRVLLIDDDLVSREVLATVLTMGGYTVHTAADGADALALLDAGESSPEVILVDTQMPGLSGAELLNALRLRSRAKLFAISGSAAPDEVTRAADGFLLKPFGSDALRKLLEEKGPPVRLFTTAEDVEEPPVLNGETLAQLRDTMSEDKLRELYAAVLADLTQRIEAVDAAFQRQDLDSIRRIGHSIKGGCAMAGAAQVARLGAMLEKVAFEPGSDQLDNRARWVRDLRAAALNLERMLKAEFPT
jgi:CheY-like chemotaxis protein